jgi:tetratricopeptide (TPR) repeat protein
MLARRLDERPVIARALLALGMLDAFQADYARARTLLEESLVLYRPLGDSWGLGMALCQLAQVVSQEGDHVQAHILLDEALVLARGTGEHHVVASALEVQGVVAFAVGDYAAAGSLWEASLRRHQQLGINLGVATVENRLGLLALRLGDYVTARARYQASLEHQQGWPYWVIHSLAGLAGVAAGTGQAERALRLAGAATALGEAAALRLPGPDRVMLAGAIDAAKAALDERAAMAAWAGGQAMTVEAAIALALEDADAVGHGQ